MAVGSGLGASVGLAAESVYGTYTPPSRWHDPSGAVTLQFNKTTYQGGGVAAGRLSQPGSLRVVTSKGGSGAIPLEVRNVKMGVLLQHLFGSTPTPTQQNTSTGYLQAHTLVDNVGKMLTGQVGIPDTGGTVRPYTFLGGKIMAAEFACSVDQPLQVTLDMDFRDLTEAQSLVAPSYTAGQKPFHFAQWTPKLGAVSSEAAVVGVRGFTLRIERPQDTERKYGGNAGLKLEPLMNDYAVVSGSVTIDYVTKADFVDRFVADTSTSMVHEFVGASLGGSPTIFETFRLRTPMTFFDEGTPQMGENGVIGLTVPFTVQNDLTNAIASCDYISTDTSL